MAIFPKNKIYTGSAMFAIAVFLLSPTHPGAMAQTDPENVLTLKINEASETVPYKDYSGWFSFTPSLSFDKSYDSEMENTDFCPQKNFICDLLLTQQDKFHAKKNVTISFDEEKAASFLEKLSTDVNESPTNAKFKMDEGKVSAFVPEENGFELDREKSLEILSSSFKDAAELNTGKEISLPYKIVRPEIKAGDINDLGIHALIGEGKSDFKGSPGSRIHNIKVATEKYDGVLLAPGEEFSFVEILGPVDGEHGYLPELVIKNDKTEPEFGGGICQVSTTAFRAAIYSGLEITARKNHSYAVSYYNPPGMDSTIYVPRPDLKFKNNTPGYILIQTKIEGTELTFSFYGTDDGRKIEIDGPHILERNADGSMRTTFTQTVTGKNGSTLIDDTFNSFYDSPSKYPHPSTETLTKKPQDWSKKQWEAYKKANNL
ncbi:MAG: VanW family protein [Candidatus Moranbacteria bacterium GW2011_GWE1_49_15]|nr:MAG: VanW family protein [Candidatus Moranbacteria bacterium GW2011_GWE2_47_10]KKW07388.1 MAG: VanW family protein [Candidatus Moranbacteria bacterium GW2011_GWE1_49_15]HBP00910.1 hypothetical protein [Candidatus Moranbacteria bacterium]